MPPVPSITSSPPQKQQPPPSEASAPMTMKSDSFTANDTVLRTAYDVPSDPAPPPAERVDDDNEPSYHAPHASPSSPSTRSHDDPDRRSPQHVSDPDYSVGSRRASEQMAEYLDRVESSDAVHDICSFSDVDLSSPRHGDEENPDHGGADGNGSGQEGAYARARKKYYLLPMLIRYHLPILGCVLVFGMFVVAISLSAAIARDNRQNAEQLQQQQQQLGGRGNAGAGAGGDVVINDAPPVVYENVGSEETSTIHSPKPPVDAGYADDSDETGEGDEILGDPMEETPQPTSVAPARPTNAPTPLASSSGTHASASHTPANPQWYTTSHPDYQTILLDSPNDDASDPVQKAHLHARDFCLARSATLCTYRRYCPDGPSSPPYDDENESGTNRDDRVPSTIFYRNPSEWEQWAPLASSGETH
eukprot:CAMPEP_0171363202 /NCGR_PEP_ID=MMETSP0879-20121228/3209_1 /TAXON_ID=67004 /ORGANISM="Thalassiosira weissflogii, Strain CCMP1336" /LENGTH=418 /DNA_ID=CAMNT_0011870315 /DNA_START=234 /DNA_END=1487 /DNA_ORIENTATION=+